jgi:TP901 family phage tail tape measure protein
MPSNNNDETVIILKGVQEGVSEMKSSLRDFASLTQELMVAVRGLTAVQQDAIKTTKQHTEQMQANAAVEREKASSTDAATKATKAETKATAESTKAARASAAAWSQVSQARFNASKGKRGPGGEMYTGLQPDALKGFKMTMQNLMPDMKEGHMVSQTIAQATANIKKFNAAVNGIPIGKSTNMLSGIANQDTIRGIKDGNLAFTQLLTNHDKFLLKMDNAGTVIKQWGQHITNLGKQMQWTGRQMMIGITLPVVLGATKAINAFVDFNKEVTRMARVFGGDIVPGDAMFAKLEKQVKEVSLKYHEMGRDVAGVFADIASQGIPTDQIKGFADEVLRIQKIGDLDTESATNFFRTIRSIFVASQHYEGGKLVEGTRDLGKSLTETQDIMNYFITVADKTNIHLNDLAEALPIVAASANVFGLSAQETSSILAGMYQNGIDAAEGANGLKFILQRIVNPTDKAAESFNNYYKAATGEDIDFKNIQGTGMQKIQQIADLIQKLGPVGQQRLLGDIGGLRQANRFVVALRQMLDGTTQVDEALKKFNGKNFDDATRGMNDFTKATVAATINNKELRETAETKLNIVLESPAEQWELLKVQFNFIMIELGNLILPFVIKIGGIILKILNNLMALPDPFKKLIMGGVIFLAALGPINFMIGQMATSLGTVTTAIGMMFPSLKTWVEGMSMANTRIGQVLDRFKILEGPMTRFKNFWKKGKVDTGVFDTLKTALSDIGIEAEGGAATFAAAEGVKTAAVQATNAALLEQMAILQNEGPANAISSGLSQTQLPMFGPDIDTTGRARVPGGQPGAGSFTKKTSLFAGQPLPDMGQVSLFDPDDIAMANGNAIKMGIFEAITEGTDEAVAMAEDVVPKGFFSKLMGKGGMMGMVKGIGPAIAGLVSAAGPIGLVVAGIAALVVAVIALIPVLAKVTGHWDEFWGVAKQGVEAIKQAWDRAMVTIKPALDDLKNAFAEVWSAIQDSINIVIDAFGGLSEESENSVEKTKTGWQGAGNLFATIFELIARGIEIAAKVFTVWAKIVAAVARFVANVIQSMSGYFRAFGGFIASVIGFVVALVKGDFKNAIKWFATGIVNLVALVIQALIHMSTGLLRWIKPIAMIADWLISKVDKARASLVKMIGAKPVFGSFNMNLSPANEKEAQNVGGDIAENVGEGMKEGLEEETESIFANFLSKLQGNLTQQISDMKDAAMEAMTKQHEAALKKYDEQIEAIEELEKKEEELAATQEYLRNRREAQEEHALDAENYRRNRALAIYEGRIDDARGLDLDFKKATNEYNTNITDMDAARAKELLDAARQAQKDLINETKEAQAEIFKAQEESFKKQLDLITQYTPRTIEEYQKMIDGINNLLTGYGAPTLGAAWNNALGSYRAAVDKTKIDLIHDAFWNGKDLAAAWLVNFAGVSWTDIFGKDPNKTSLDATDLATDFDTSMPSTDFDGGGITPELPPEKFDFFANHGDMGGAEAEYKNIGKNLGDKLVDGIVGGLLFLPMLIINAFSGTTLSTIIDSIGTVGGDIAKGLWNGFMDGIGDAIVSMVEDIVNWFKKAFQIESPSKIFMEIGGMLMEGLVQGIAMGIEGLIGFFMSLPEKIFNALVGGGNFLLRIGEFIMNQIASGMGKAIGGVWGWFNRLIPDSLVDTLKGIINRVLKVIYGGLNKVIDFMNKAIDIVNKLPFVSIPNIPNIHAPEFHGGGLVGGAKDEIAAILQKGEYVIKKDAVKALGIPMLNAMNAAKPAKPLMPSSVGSVNSPQSAATNSGGGDTYISVDTFIGQKQWFDGMMKDHKMKMRPKGQRAKGTLNRRVGSYQDNTVRYD